MLDGGLRPFFFEIWHYFPHETAAEDYPLNATENIAIKNVCRSLYKNIQSERERERERLPRALKKYCKARTNSRPILKPPHR